MSARKKERKEGTKEEGGKRERKGERVRGREGGIIFFPYRNLFLKIVFFYA